MRFCNLSANIVDASANAARVGNRGQNAENIREAGTGENNIQRIL